MEINYYIELLKKDISLIEAIELTPFPTILGKNGIFIHANKLAFSLFEADSPDQLIGRNSLDFAHKDSLTEIVEDIETANARIGHPFSIRKIVTIKQNVMYIESKLIPITFQGEELDYILIKNYKEVSDIETQYNMQQKHYQTLIDNSIDTVALVTDYTFKYINKAGLILLGAKDIDEVIGRSVLDFFHPRYHQDILTRGEKIINNQEVDPSREREMIRLDGDTRFVESVVMPFYVDNKPSLQIIIRDITEQKENLRHTIQTEKLLTAGQLSAGIAHEIRNPLTSIKGFLQLLEDKFPESDQKFLNIVKDEIDKIERITGEMLSLSKPQALKYNNHNLITLIQEVVTLLEPQAHLKNVELNLLTKDDLLFINCDKSRIKQVFINLIKNAIDSMPNGGVVSAIICRPTKNQVNINIKDEGCGIAPELMEKINEPFFTTKGTGTGLGLTICNNIVKEHGGKITVRSIENKGTTFTVKFSLVEES